MVKRFSSRGKDVLDAQSPCVVFAECAYASNARLVARLLNAHFAVETSVDLDAVMWAEVRAAIIESPRFAEMYAAGGMLNDGVANVVAWLKSPEKTSKDPVCANISPLCDVLVCYCPQAKTSGDSTKC